VAESETGRYEQQRHAAIRAAASVFAEKGFHGSSTRDIAERMGIKQGSLYYYFKSKEEALSEVCLYGMQDYAGRMVSIANSEQPFRAKLTATITSHITKYREKNEALKVYNAERLYLDESKRTRLHELGSGYRQQLEGIFRAAQENGDVRKDVDCRFASQAVIGLCNSWGELIVRDPDMDIYEIIENTVGLILNGFSNKQNTNEKE
jgi:AcrR family transcriptional regulator